VFCSISHKLVLITSPHQISDPNGAIARTASESDIGYMLAFIPNDGHLVCCCLQREIRLNSDL